MKRNYDFSKGAKIKGQIKSGTQVENAVNESEKVLTSIRLDNDIIEIAKRNAKKEHMGYLTWINMKLRKAILGEQNLEDRVEKIEHLLRMKTVKNEK